MIVVLYKILLVFMNLSSVFFLPALAVLKLMQSASVSFNKLETFEPMTQSNKLTWIGVGRALLLLMTYIGAFLTIILVAALTPISDSVFEMVLIVCFVQMVTNILVVIAIAFASLLFHLLI